MAKIEQLPLGHLVNPNKTELQAQNLIHLLERRSKSDAIAITFLDRQNNESHRTYDDLLEGARIVATFLKNRGLQKGDKVILLLVTGQDFINCFFGTIMAGGIPVAVSPPMTFGDIKKYLANLEHIVRDSDARYMISFPRIRKVIGSVLSGENNLAEFFLAKDITSEPAKYAGFPSIDADQAAFFQYTSGSTGKPKGVMLSHRALLHNIDGISQGVNCTEKDISVSWLPLFHDMGLIGSLLTTLYSGVHLYTMTPESFVMNPIGWLKNISKYRATIATAPNFAYHLLATRMTQEDLFALDLSCLKVALNGAEPVDLQTLDTFEKLFGQVGYQPNVSFPVYGMAENCLAATFPTLGSRVETERLDRLSLEESRLATKAAFSDPSPYLAVSVGGPIAGQEIAILAGRQGFARENQVGEIMVKSPSLMMGYYKNERATQEAIRNGWLRTGDLGFVNNGRLFITGRAKEMIIKRGRNYYPYDIERAASSITSVRKGCLVAFSIPNQKTGTEDLVLVAETRETDEARKQDVIKSISSEVLATVGIRPDKTVLVPPRSIPKTSSGKLQRLLAKQHYLEGTLVKGASDRWITPVKTLVDSFIGNQRFRLRVR